MHRKRVSVSKRLNLSHNSAPIKKRDNNIQAEQVLLSQAEQALLSFSNASKDTDEEKISESKDRAEEEIGFERQMRFSGKRGLYC
jgi:hypothetical protein